MLPKRYAQLRAASEEHQPEIPPEPMDCAGMAAYCILLITIALVALSYVTSYWLVNDDPPENYEKAHQGMFATCNGDVCTWYFSKDSKLGNEHWPDWFKATQGLMSLGLALGLLALLIATLSLCCTCHSCNLNVPICTLLIVSCLSMGVGICIFGIKARNDWNIDIEWDITTRGRFGWSFWVGIGATALALLTGCMYGCMGRKQQ